MVISLRAWAMGFALILATIGVCMVFSTALQAPQTRLSQHKQLLPGGRVSRSSSSSSSEAFSRNAMQLWMSSSSSSSSSPVEPIKPLLDLSSRVDGGEPPSQPSHPLFDGAAPRNVSGLTGTAAYLHCLVHNLGNSSVSWIRQRDLHIITVGHYTYTTDQRYEVLHSPGSRDWILKIKYAQERDSGYYECQVSTKPVMSYVVHLNVFAAPLAQIIGSPDMHVDMGSTINLTCVITHSSHPPAYISWHHNDEEVNYDSPRGGITVVTERGNTTTTYLLIQDARAADTGNYSCSSSNTAATTIRVHVLHGETPAAMQTNGGESLWAAPSCLLPRPLLLLPVITLFIISSAIHHECDTVVMR